VAEAVAAVVLAVLAEEVSAAAARAGDGNLKMWKFGNLKMWRFENLKMWGFGNLRMWKFGNLRMWRFGNLRMWGFEDLETKGCFVHLQRISKSPNPRIFKFPNLRIIALILMGLLAFSTLESCSVFKKDCGCPSVHGGKQRR